MNQLLNCWLFKMVVFIILSCSTFITCWGIDLDYSESEWFALEMNRGHPVIFEIASKYCISDSFVDHDGYSISSEVFLPAVVDVMVI